MHGYSLQIKNVNDKNKDGDSQVLLSLMALTYYHCEREPMIGAIVHPLRVSLFCVPRFYNILDFFSVNVLAVTFIYNCILM